MVQLPKAQLNVPLDVRSWPARMGMKPGGNIVLMADLTRLAWAWRKAGERFISDDLLDAFCEHAGSTGTIAVPTFNYDLKSGEPFDIRRTQPISGALGQAALAHHAFARTSQPLHSFAVAGALQDRFLNISDPSSFGQGSAFALLHGHAFQLLAIGMPLEPALTYVHFVEESMMVKYRERRRIPIQYTDAHGIKARRMYELYAKKPGYVNDLKALEPLLIDAGCLVKQEADGLAYLRLSLPGAHSVIELDILHNKAGSIVQFSLIWWLRDILRPYLRRGRPSRSALSIE